jgi:hypothetical protein
MIDIKHKTQSTLEMGIFGTILLTVIVQLVGYLQISNEKQYVAMKSFREALHTAYYNCRCYNDPSNIEDEGYDCACDWSDPNCFAEGGRVVNQKINHLRGYSGGFFTKGSRTPVSSSAYIYWGKPRRVVEDYDGNTPIIGLESIERFDTYTINDNQYDTAREVPEGDDPEDVNDNGIEDEVEQKYSGLYCDAYTPAEYCTDGYLDVDSDGIPNWQDDNVNGYSDSQTTLVMQPVEEVTHKKTKEENPNEITNTSELTIKDKIKISFVDLDTGDPVTAKNRLDDGTLREEEEYTQYLTQVDTDGDGEVDTYQYVDDGGTHEAEETVSWTTPK